MRLVRNLSLALILAVLAATIAAWMTLRASLPRLEGSVSLTGLNAPVIVERDELGVVTLRGATRIDLARATGYVHAQDRFFQMDLARRRAAGELAGLFGPVAVDTDRRNRLHRFRHRAERVLAAAGPAEAALLAAYAGGVNSGLDDLSARPWEYLVLGAETDPWRPEDSLLVTYSMFLELNDSRGDREAGLELMDRALPAEMVSFILPPGTDWDAPLAGGAHAVPDIPGPEVFVVERGASAPLSALGVAPPTAEALAGSNNWAVAGAASATGAAMVANDMHLGLRVPNTFYRLRLELDGPEFMAVTGASLPGTPLIVAGSTGRVAWGFTNSYGDWTDVISLETDPEDPSRYRTPAGWRVFQCVEEVIPVADAAPATETVCETVWGPVLPGVDETGPRALKWLAHELEAVNLGLMNMETVNDVDEAVAVANRAGLPAQNIVIADHEGRIAWTIAGRIPIRAGYDPDRPASWAVPGTGWIGWAAAEDYPRIVDPGGARVWTANARVAEGEQLALLGDGGYALGARAGRIRDRLRNSDALSIGDMLAIQLDDEASFYERWRELALEALAGPGVARDVEREEYRRLVQDWIPRASKDSVGFRLVYEFRQRVLALVFEGLTGPVRELDPDFSLDEGLRYGVGRQFEGPAWRLVTERPAHLLHPAFDTWDGLLLAAIDATADGASRDGPLTGESWGRRNMAAIRHPLSGALPLFSAWLDMPTEPLDGATHMPRVQQPAFGASERFAVSPGREEEGYFHMPVGQSGHPLSPFYKAGHRAWVDGEPTPFLPGAPIHEIRFSPDSG